jgi:LysM repeat protein
VLCTAVSAGAVLSACVGPFSPRVATKMPDVDSDSGAARAGPAPALTVPPPVDASVTDAPGDGLPVQMRTYVVEPGDSVRVIARQFGVTNETIIWVNDLTDPDLLLPGQKLEILPFSGLIHEVRAGDTVASIADGYEAKIDDVIRANRLQPPYTLAVGQRLVVPGGYRPLPKKVTRAASRKLPVLGATPQEQFIALIADAAMDSHERTGIPASATIAQAILESYWGSSRLAREANNFFGLKAQTKPGPAGVMWLDVWEAIGGYNRVQREPFRVYSDVAESFLDYGRFFIENGRYAAALAERNDPKRFVREISRAGYATDPTYAGKLIGLMDRYDLYRFDE